MTTMQKLGRAGSKAGWTIITLVAIVGVATAALQVGVRTGAVASFHVTTWSMAPALDAGDLIVSTPTDAADVQVGDIITVEDDNATGFTTHRVVAVEAGTTPETRTFTLKGDANDFVDAKPYEFAEVFVQRAAFPKAGAIMDFASTPPTSYYLLLIFGALLVLTFTSSPSPSSSSGKSAKGARGRRRAGSPTRSLEDVGVPREVPTLSRPPAGSEQPPAGQSSAVSPFPSRRELHRGKQRGRRAA